MPFKLHARLVTGWSAGSVRTVVGREIDSGVECEGRVVVVVVGGEKGGGGGVGGGGGGVGGGGEGGGGE